MAPEVAEWQVSHEPAVAATEGEEVIGDHNPLKSPYSVILDYATWGPLRQISGTVECFSHSALLSVQDRTPMHGTVRATLAPGNHLPGCRITVDARSLPSILAEYRHAVATLLETSPGSRELLFEETVRRANNPHPTGHVKLGWVPECVDAEVPVRVLYTHWPGTNRCARPTDTPVATHVAIFDGVVRAGRTKRRDDIVASLGWGPRGVVYKWSTELGAIVGRRYKSDRTHLTTALSAVR